MARPVVSVIMPVFNAGEYLRDAILSILRQTEKDIELILVDDGSTDKSSAVALEIAGQDPRLKYYRQHNAGIVAALNKGLDLAQGDYIARMDADDIASPDRVSKQLAFMIQNPHVIACGSDVRLFGARKGRMRLPSSDSACKAMLFIMPCFAHPAVMFRRSIVDMGIRYRSEYQYVEDYDLWIRISRYGHFANIARPLLDYRIHANQITTSKRDAQKKLHLTLSLEHLRSVGVVVDETDLAEMLWPSYARSRLSVFLFAVRFFSRLGSRGYFSMLLFIKVFKGLLS